MTTEDGDDAATAASPKTTAIDGRLPDVLLRRFATELADDAATGSADASADGDATPGPEAVQP